jgi:peroxiredoxin
MKNILLVFAAVLLFAACSNEQKFQISGTLTDFGNTDEPTMLYLKTRDINEQLVNVDSTYLTKNETFVLKGKSLETDIYFLADKDNVFVLRIFVDPGSKITVTGTATDVPALKVEGSATHELYTEYMMSLTHFQEEQEMIRYNYMMYAQSPSISEEDLTEIEERLVADYEALDKQIEETTLEFIKENANTIVAAYLVYRNTATMGNSEEIEKQFQLLDSEMSNKFVTLVKNRLEKLKQTEVGAVLSNIELPNPEGKIISLESLRGKYVFVDFWASWCGPCVREIPNLKIAYDKFHQQGFEIISISLDNDKESWLNGIAKHELNWLHVSDLQAFNSPVAKQLAVAYVPHTFLLAPDGTIIAVDLRGEELENRLADVMP